MKKPSVLIVEDEEDIRELIIIILESYFDLDFIEASNSQEGISRLEGGVEPTIIFCDYNMPGGNGDQVFKFNKDHANVPFILISTDSPSDHHELAGFYEINKGNEYIEKPFDSERIVQNIGQFLSNEQVEKIEFQRISINRVQKYNRQNEALYLRLSENKFVKIIDKGSPLSDSELQKYRDKSVEFFFLEKEAHKRMLQGSLKKMIKKIAGANNKNELIQIQFESVVEIQNAVKSLGVDEVSIELADKITESVMNEVSQVSKIETLAKELNADINTYKSSLAHIINYLSAGFCEHYDCPKEDTVKTLIKASIFCNISLDDDGLASFCHLSKDVLSLLEFEDRKIVKDHIKKSVKILNEGENQIKDVSKIIECHHEKPDGSGHPKGLNSRSLTPIQCAFILIHDFADVIIREKNPDDISALKIFEKLGEKYTINNFEQPYLALKKALE
ncbi:MAG: response regulator [Bacteriovoracaceae bacterium]|jgi:response regulator RpfG family c-di-GMP phosphodiesterase|nr:response regulator [Bacteriovoracaceae bacterium]